MLGRVLVLAALAGCAAPVAAVPDGPVACPPAADAPARLPRLVTPDLLRARYYAERAARLEDEDALDTCATAYARLRSWAVNGKGR